MKKVKLKDLGQIITGNTPKTSDDLNYISNDICFVKPSDIKDGTITYLADSEFYISEYARSKARILPPKSILVTCIGIIGKIAINNIECSFNQQINAIIPSDNCLTEYLAYALQSKQMEMQDIANAPVVPILNKTQFSEIEIYLPSLEEQKAIAERLDKVSGLIEKRKTQLEKLNLLIKSRFIEMFNDPKYNTSNLVKIGEIGALTSGGTPSRAKPEYFEGDIRWYSAGELNALYLPDSVEHISEMALQQSSAKLFNKGTLMIGMYDTAAFKMGILTKDSSSNQACANLNPKQGYNIVWLYYLFDIMKPIFLQERQGVRQKNLSLSKIKEFEVPFAPFELQEQFATFVEQIDKSKFQIQKSLEKLEILKKSLMQQYFG